jgi:hypothetical protein
MRLEGWNWSLPAIAMVVGVGVGLVLILTRGLWKSLPGLVKFVVFAGFITLLILFALGRLSLPF